LIDNSSNNLALTRNGDVSVQAYSPFGSISEATPQSYSIYLDGTGDYFTFPNNSAFAFGTGSFTIEFWINPSSSCGAYATIISKGVQANRDWAVYINAASSTARDIAFYYSPTQGDYSVISTAGAITYDTWQHVAVVSNNSAIKIYVNGTQVATGTQTQFNSSNPSTVNIGRFVDYTGPNSQPFIGNISNLRFVTGTALYTTTFTPSTTPLTAISGTSLLTCQNNRFIDNSSNNYAISPTQGTPTVQVFSPFEPTAAYSAGTTGGSGYFDGSGDYLTAPANTAFNLGTGDFTIECWVYLTNSTATTQSIMGIGDTGTTNDIQLWYNNVANKITFNVYGNPRFDSSSTVTTGNWIHLACTRASGTFKLFINGAQEATGSLGNNLSNNVLVIGRPYASLPNNEYFYGYISNLRIVKGTAVYTSAFTPPTSPVTAISGTSILTNYTNGGIIDNAMINNLETVGDAKISTAQSKFGGSSMLFDGTGDKLFMPSSPNYAFGTGDFTVEAWVYLNAIPGALTYPPIFEVGTNFYVNFRGSGTVALTDNTTVYAQSGSSLATNAWYHVAIVRASGSSKVYINGTGGTAVACTVNFSQDTASIGAGGNGAGSPFYLNGYIDDLRITKGYARYTANFTPPTAALPTY
jgi:hypothetical protein